MKAIYAALAIISQVYFVLSSSNWFTVVNLSPYHFQISDDACDGNFGSVTNIRPLSEQSFEIRSHDGTRCIQIDYGSRLKLYFANDVDRVKLEDVRHDSTISYDYDSRRNTLTIRASYAKVENFSFIVSSDPQPYRLPNNGDPNAQRSLWIESTKPVFRRIAKEEKGVDLMIVNGDLTEFGRTTQYKTFQSAISEISIRMAFGLGNHDYENNVEDCADVDPKSDDAKADELANSCVPTDWSEDSSPDWFRDSVPPDRIQKNTSKLIGSMKNYFSVSYLKRLSNLCARRMVKRMRDHIGNLSKVLADFSSDEQSLAYGWNYGSVLRFVQLHNRLHYQVKLKGFLQSTVSIMSSFDWLINDMNTHKERSYILNIHDAMSHADLEDLRPYFGRIKAIFAGHTHEAGVKCFNGIAIFDSGALFNNEFFRVNFSKDGRCFDILHFAGDKYAPPLATNYCFQSILDNPCKSN